VGANVTATWLLTANNAGSVNGFAFSSVENLTGGSAGDTFLLSPGGGLAGTLNGGADTDTLVGTDTANTWTISGASAGNLNGSLNFTAVENLTGGASSDAFAFQAGKTVFGIL